MFRAISCIMLKVLLGIFFSLLTGMASANAGDWQSNSSVAQHQIEMSFFPILRQSISSTTSWSRNSAPHTGPAPLRGMSKVCTSSFTPMDEHKVSMSLEEQRDGSWFGSISANYNITSILSDDVDVMYRIEGKFLDNELTLKFYFTSYHGREETLGILWYEGPLHSLLKLSINGLGAPIQVGGDLLSSCAGAQLYLFGMSNPYCHE